MSKQYWVYMLASKKGGTLYIGITSALARRVGDHKDDVIDGFTRQYSVHRLVYFEEFGDVHMAISREKRLKGWNRAWKIKLIEKNNPNWSDLYPSIVG